VFNKNPNKHGVAQIVIIVSSPFHYEV